MLLYGDALFFTTCTSFVRSPMRTGFLWQALALDFQATARLGFVPSPKGKRLPADVGERISANIRLYNPAVSPQHIAVQLQSMPDTNPTPPARAGASSSAEYCRYCRHRALGGYIWLISGRRCNRNRRIPPIPAGQIRISLCSGSSETTHQACFHIDEHRRLDAALSSRGNSDGAEREIDLPSFRSQPRWFD